MELFLAATGTQVITLLYLAVKIADTESGINMAVNYIAHLLTITLLPVLNGLQMAITLPLDLSKC
jgi:hypothetical protein